MIRILTCAAAIWLAAVSNASAQFVLFSGAGYVTAATFQCGGEGIFQSAFMLGSYLPANLGGNADGAQLNYVSLPQAAKPFAVAHKSVGALTATFQKVNATMISPLEVKTYKPSVKVKSKPAVIDEATQSADVEVSIRNANGIADCDFTLNLNLGRRPG